MALVSVPALKALMYQGRSYVRGERVRMPAIEAAARARKGEVTLTVGAHVPMQARDLSAETVAETPVRTRRQYRRRDMTAESSSLRTDD